MMDWIFIAVVSGMLMTGTYATEEQCLGRKAILEKEKITNSKCIDMRNLILTGHTWSSPLNSGSTR